LTSQSIFFEQEAAGSLEDLTDWIGYSAGSKACKQLKLND